MRVVEKGEEKEGKGEKKNSDDGWLGGINSTKLRQP